MNKNSMKTNSTQILEIKINISNHCYERYHERVRECDGPFTESLKPKYTEEITKLFNSCEKIYNGIIGHSTKPVDVYTNKFGWVFIVDPNSNTLITLYRVDLGLTEDFNKEFIRLSLNKIQEMSDELAKLEKQIYDSKFEINQKVLENEEQLRILTRQINDLKFENENLAGQKRVLDNKLYQARIELRNVIEGYMVRESARIK